jgi:predicted O-linked N-acetylglucosamine transferase (SPINDLY family)
MKFLFRRRAASGDPVPDGVAWEDLIAEGNALEDAGDAEGARVRYEHAVAAAPDAWRARLNLGNALRGLGRLDEAAAEYRHAIALQPEAAGPHFNLGNVLVALGDATAAAESYRAALRFRPDWPEGWFGLACALDRQGETDEAIAACEKALSLKPDHAAAVAMLAGLLQNSGDAKQASARLDDALRSAPDSLALLRAKAEIEKQTGHAAEAIDAYRRAIAVDPDDLALRNAFLFALNFDETLDAEAILAEHRAFGEHLEARVERMRVRAPRDASQRLRVGYLSPDFRRHSVSCFVEPLLRHHDRGAVEVHCYYNHEARDEITERFMTLADRWHDIVALDDDEVAQHIVDDGIDILVDLAGHTTGNRLAVFARKPAPLQFTWLGYLATTGLRTIDYRLCDARTDPSGVAERWQVETPARLPDAQWCYQPQVPLPAVTPLPRLSRGHWTFGSFNQASKLNPRLLLAWAELLAAIPDSRLRIVGAANDLFEANTRAVFENAGLAANRLELIGRIDIEAYFSTYAGVDIALDAFPYNGATTTCDALLMGVPVATIAGDRAIARGGKSLLGVLGLDDWVAESHEALVPMLLRQTADPQRLAVLRAELPQRMRASPLMDGPRFARGVEAVFRDAWRKACETPA